MHKAAIAANEKAFNQKFVHEYDKRSSIQRVSAVCTKIILEYDGSENAVDTSDLSTKNPANSSNSLIRPSIKYLDFACGTGMVTSSIYPYLSKDSEVVGIDISPSALDEFKRKFAHNNNVSAQICDILDENEDTTVYTNQFDLITCTMSFHHLHNYRDVTKKLATFLRPGGRLAIIDFYNKDVEDKGSADPNSAVQHMGGLALDKIKDCVQSAGLHNVHSFKAASFQIWQTMHFLENHSPKKIQEMARNGEVESKDENGQKVFWIEVDLCVAVGTK